MTTKSHRSQDAFQVEPAVYILESPDPDIHERHALAAALTLADITHTVAEITDRTSLRVALAAAADRVRRGSRGRPIVPTVHISAHGDKMGVYLASGELMGWEELREHLLDFAVRSNRMNPQGMCLVNVSMSTCEGASAVNMFGFGAPYPCAGLVGPTTTVEHADALVAFVNFYHLTIRKDWDLPSALAPMNIAAGANVFCAFEPGDFMHRLSQRGRELAAEFEQWRHGRAERSEGE